MEDILTLQALLHPTDKTKQEERRVVEDLITPALMSTIGQLFGLSSTKNGDMR